MNTEISAQALADKQKSMSADDAIQALIDGNQRFVDNNFSNKYYTQHIEATSGGQYPFAAVLSCIDSRVPAEIVFDQGIGDIFSARVAGNVVDMHVLGSLEYAVAHAGSKAIVVLGHTSCGAVGGACGDLVHGVNLTGLLAAIRPAVKAVSEETKEAITTDKAFVNKVVNKNVFMTINEMLRRSPIINDLVNDGTIKVVPAVYDVESGNVTFL